MSWSRHSVSKSSRNERHSNCTELFSCPPPTLSPFCPLFSPTSFQTQTFSVHLWRAPLGKWKPRNKGLYAVRLEVIQQTASLFTIPSWLPLFELNIFTHFSSHSQCHTLSRSVGGHSIFNRHGIREWVWTVHVCRHITPDILRSQ